MGYMVSGICQVGSFSLVLDQFLRPSSGSIMGVMRMIWTGNQRGELVYTPFFTWRVILCHLSQCSIPVESMLVAV